MDVDSELIVIRRRLDEVDRALKKPAVKRDDKRDAKAGEPGDDIDPNLKNAMTAIGDRFDHFEGRLRSAENALALDGLLMNEIKSLREAVGAMGARVEEALRATDAVNGFEVRLEATERGLREGTHKPAPAVDPKAPPAAPSAPTGSQGGQDGPQPS